MSALETARDIDTHHDERAAPPRTLLVNELYASIQGESTHAGRPCVFIRLTGCPLRCTWCDSEFSFSGGERLELVEILARVRAFGIGLVEVTGGEPLAQPHALPLLHALCDAGYEVLLETSGAYDLANVDPRVARIVDIKCPGSGETKRNIWANLALLNAHDELKFVLADRGDYDYAREVLAQHDCSGVGAIHFSPVVPQKPGDAGLAPAELAEWIIADKLPVRLQLQLHKQIWPAATRGV